MKKILITGANSYIGTSFEKYMSQWPNQYQIDTVDMIDGSWREKSFSGYDAVFHVAGIAHQKETKENAHLYYEVNRNLAIDTAKKAKADGVSQFIFLSSMSVYGLETGIITKETIPNPKSNYGKSKLQAEEVINILSSDSFSVCILRPPMVYGKDCKGNFQTVVKIVEKFPIFPRIKNKRSMIYIENLCSFVKFCLEKGLNGLYFPQNEDYIGTTDIARTIANSRRKKRYFSFLLGFCFFFLRPFFSVTRKAFGTLVYESTEEFEFAYCTFDNDSSIKKSI